MHNIFKKVGIINYGLYEAVFFSADKRYSSNFNIKDIDDTFIGEFLYFPDSFHRFINALRHVDTSTVDIKDVRRAINKFIEIQRKTTTLPIPKINYEVENFIDYSNLVLDVLYSNMKYADYHF